MAFLQHHPGLGAANDEVTSFHHRTTGYPNFFGRISSPAEIGVLYPASHRVGSSLHVILRGAVAVPCGRKTVPHWHRCSQVETGPSGIAHPLRRHFMFLSSLRNL